jgi:hypothetical protein
VVYVKKQDIHLVDALTFVTRQKTVFILGEEATRMMKMMLFF